MGKSVGCSLIRAFLYLLLLLTGSILLQFSEEEDEVDEWAWDEDVGGWGDDSEGLETEGMHTDDDLSSLEDAMDVAPEHDVPNAEDIEEHDDIENS